MSAAHRTPLRIDSGHPSLAGHFPGNPVVPGVVVLERVAAALREWRGARIARLDAKFVRPLLPDEAAQIELAGEASRVSFAVTHADGGTLASGTLVTDAALVAKA